MTTDKNIIIVYCDYDRTLTLQMVDDLFGSFLLSGAEEAIKRIKERINFINNWNDLERKEELQKCLMQTLMSDEFWNENSSLADLRAQYQIKPRYAGTASLLEDLLSSKEYFIGISSKNSYPGAIKGFLETLLGKDAAAKIIISSFNNGRKGKQQQINKIKSQLPQGLKVIGELLVDDDQHNSPDHPIDFLKIPDFDDPQPYNFLEQVKAKINEIRSRGNDPYPVIASGIAPRTMSVRGVVRQPLGVRSDAPWPMMDAQVAFRMNGGVSLDPATPPSKRTRFESDLAPSPAKDGEQVLVF